MAALIAMFVVALDYNTRHTIDRLIVELIPDRKRTQLTKAWERVEPLLRYSGMFGMTLGLLLLSLKTNPIVWVTVSVAGVLAYLAAPMWHLVEWKR